MEYSGSAVSKALTAILSAVILALLVLSPALLIAETEEDRDFRRPLNAFEAQQYSFAHRHFLLFVSKYPQSSRLTEVYLRLGICSYWLTEYERAKSELLVVITRFPMSQSDNDARYWLGETAISLKEYSQAVEFFRSVLSSPFHSAYQEDASLSLSYSLFRIGEAQEALAVLDAYAKKETPKKFNQFTFQRGMCLFDLQRYDEAQRAFEYLVDRSGDKEYAIKSLYWLAECYYKLNRFNSAIETYFRVRKNTTDKDVIERVLYGLGWAYFKIADYDDSLATFQELMRFAPQSKFASSAIFKIGESLYHLARYDEAADQFARVAEYPELKDAVRFFIGECRFRLGKHEEALKSLMAVSEDADLEIRLMALRDIGLCNYELQRNDKALAAFEKMFELAGDETTKAQALAFQADVYFAMGDTQRALDTYQTVLEKYAAVTNVPKVRYFIGMSLLKQGLFDKAILIFEDTHTRYLEDEYGCMSLYQHAEALRRKGDYEPAATLYRRFLALPGISDKLRSKARFGAAVCLFNAGSRQEKSIEEALQEFTKLAVESPDQEVALDALFESGRCLLQLKRYTEAERVFRRIVDAYPTKSVASSSQFEIAYSYYSRGLMESADIEFSKLAEGFPKSDLADDALYYSASIAYEARLAGRARRLIDKMLSDYPASELIARAKILSVSILVLEGKVEQALEEYRQLRIKYAETPLAGLIDIETAYLLLELRREEEALALFNICAKSKVTEWAARAEWGAGRALQSLGKSREALDRFMILIFTYPDDARCENAIFEAATIHSDFGEYAAAIKLLELAKDKDRAKQRIERIKAIQGGK